MPHCHCKKANLPLIPVGNLDLILIDTGVIFAEINLNEGFFVFSVVGHSFLACLVLQCLVTLYVCMFKELGHQTADVID